MNASPIADSATRVALLARAGTACDRLQLALKDAGADIVLICDPADSDVAGVRAAGAQAILIALEPLVEEALDRYDALLADPMMTVIFDEAELAAQREGWDAARWSRHLAAKLNRHQEVLPPGSNGGDAGDAPRVSDPAPTTDAVAVDTLLQGIAVGSLQLPETANVAEAFVDASHAFDPVMAESMSAAKPSEPNVAVPDFDLDWSVAVAPLRERPVEAETDQDMGAFLDGISLDAVDLPEDRLLAAATAAAAAEADDVERHPFDPAFAEFDADAEIDLSTFASQPVVGEDAEPPFEMPALTLADEPTTATSPIELEKPPAGNDSPASTERFRMDLDALELRIADMQLEDVRPARPVSHDGAVLVMAGIGGPDAVRQLLAGLPATFPRAVLIQQRLEGARHDNLVRQMQRATKMPVRLAESGGMIERGHVYVLPADIGIAAQDDGLRFASGSDTLLSGLPAADSAVVMLSGSDPAAVDAAMALGVRGTLVAGQSAEGCFDAVACEALVARGGESGAPAELARKLAQRWQS